MPNGAASGELRSVEREIDAHHLSNPLFQQPFSVAAWWFLTICEEHMVREMIRPSDTGKHNWDSIANNVVMHAKWPLRWLTQACPQGSRVPREYDADLYKAAWQLSKHSYEYLAFESAFVEATREDDNCYGERPSSLGSFDRSKATEKQFLGHGNIITQRIPIRDI